MMMQHEDAAAKHDLQTLRGIISGGESVGESIVEWVKDIFEGADIHESYGQSEANALIGDCTRLMPRKEGAMGKPAPGHEIEILDKETGQPTVSRGEVGEIGVRYDGNPVCFKDYWNNPEKTERKVQDSWVLTEDLGVMDEDGYVSFVSRADDVIISSGYRIGPEELEDTLARHEAVLDAGVIGVPHSERGEIPKAFIVLADGVAPSKELKQELQSVVKDRLAKYEYPREIEFIEELPTTVTGKVQRAKLRAAEDE
jgi:acetyl-CoA synthetase